MRVSRRTGPKDKVGNHAVASRAHALRDGVGQSTKGRPDGFEHDVHARRADVGVDPDLVSCAHLRAIVRLRANIRIRMTTGQGSPKVDQGQSQTRHHRKVRKVESHRRTGRDGKGNMVARANSTVERDSDGNNDVADRTVKSALLVAFRYTAPVVSQSEQD